MIVPIIIPFYKAQDKLDRCLKHIHESTFRDVEVFVRDNSDDNILFTAAINEGLLKFAYRDDVKYILIQNQDAYLAPDAIEHLVAFMDDMPTCGIASPLQLASDGQTVTWGGSLDAFPWGIHHCEALSYYKTPLETFWANGASMMVRAETVREIGLFDRNMRFVFSDVDFSFSARARGWRVAIVPAAQVEHSISSSVGTQNLELAIIKEQDALYFAQKWLSGGLHRKLSYEGKRLSRLDIQKGIDQFEKNIALAKKQLESSVGFTDNGAPEIRMKKKQ
jgi:GT2 family glycosyltransferase